MSYRSGVYTIRCTANGRSYIGGCRDVGARWATHQQQLRRGIHTNEALQSDWARFGATRFVFDVVFRTPMANVLRLESGLIRASCAHCLYNVVGVSRVDADLCLLHRMTIEDNVRAVGL